jgi:hypothetical protein
MEYQFPADLQPYVDEMMTRGGYECVHDLIVDAVYMHRDTELNRRRKYAELKKEIALGVDDLDQGRSAPLDMKDVMRRVRDNVAKEKKGKKRTRSVK